MLAARGVSLGLTKGIKLNELPINDKFALGKYQRAKCSKKSEEKPKIHIKKHVDKKVGRNPVLQFSTGTKSKRGGVGLQMSGPFSARELLALVSK